MVKKAWASGSGGEESVVAFERLVFLIQQVVVFQRASKSDLGYLCYLGFICFDLRHSLTIKSRLSLKLLSSCLCFSIFCDWNHRASYLAMESIWTAV